MNRPWIAVISRFGVSYMPEKMPWSSPANIASSWLVPPKMLKISP